MGKWKKSMLATAIGTLGIVGLAVPAHADYPERVTIPAPSMYSAEGCRPGYPSRISYYEYDRLEYEYNCLTGEYTVYLY